MTMNFTVSVLATEPSVSTWIFLASVAVVVLLLWLVVRRIDKVIFRDSPKITELVALNAKTGFHQVETFFTIKRHYDNKSHYNRIQPAYLMTADIRNHIAFYTDLAQKIKENRAMYSVYCEEVSQINENITAIPDSIKSRLLRWAYRQWEKRVFKKTVLQPSLDCSYEVFMSYSSPKRQVKLSKGGTYNFDDMYTCLESVSRTYLERKTYEKLALVERGMLTDSMRYDVLRRDGFRCVLCGASADDGARLHVDHIVPVSKGGKTEYNNLRTLCERCNVGKSDKIETMPVCDVQKEDKKDEMTCPRCGGRLVLRTGALGDFYGCSKYPRCRFTRNI